MDDNAEIISQRRDTVKKVRADFPGEYWRERTCVRHYAKEFVDALAEFGLLRSC